MIELAALVKGFPDPVIVVTPELKVHLFNRTCVDLFEHIEQNAAIYEATRNSGFLEAIEKAFKNNKKTSFTFRLKKRYKRTINATLIPLKNEALHAETKSVHGSYVLFIHLRDMSEPERLAKMRMHFIANASHELRTPLASLTGFVETLQSTARNDEKARDRFLTIMAEQTRRMTRLISDLLSLSHLATHTQAPPEILVEVIETVTGVIELLRPVAEKGDIELITDFPTGPLYICGEKDELIQVFQNILQNALRYGGDGGKVWISINQLPGSNNQGPHLAISFKDNGRGIASKHLPRLTQRFYRVDKVISRNKGGTGLGLAIARHIILRHRGELKIKSKPEKGATFTVLLPECQKSTK